MISDRLHHFSDEKVESPRSELLKGGISAKEGVPGSRTCEV